jgi:hypothetical protein
MAPPFIIVPPVPALPQQGTIIHQFDFSDTDTLWRDEAGTLPVTTDGDAILRVDNKGFDGTDLTQSASSSAPTWNNGAGVINGLGVGDFTVDGVSVSATIADAAGADLGDYTVIIVLVHDIDNPATVDISFGWGSTFGEMNVQNTFNQVRAEMNDGEINTAPDPATGTEYAVIMNNDGADNQEARFSEDPTPRTRTDTSGGPADGTDFAIGGPPQIPTAFPWNGRIAEIVVWTPSLTSAERDTAELWATFKWGITWA